MDLDTIKTLITFISAGIAIYTVLSNKTKDVKEDVKEDTNEKVENATQFNKINLKLDTSCNILTDMSKKIDKMSDTINAIQQKQIEHELRIKALEKKVDIE